ncbi:FAD-dependent oxidoreductase [Nonomuraea sp. NPDC049152]|uniref:FAD-binding oxidoreductase n=1 Tax=Nonomuraea sp. NPDC049152 TaxID=3154350 RepID=UPI0034030EBD
MSDNSVRGAVRGQVLLPGDDGFDAAAKPWNVAVPQPVAAVVEAEDADDVASLIRYAARVGLTVTAQPSGHGASGDTDGVILLRTGRLDSVDVRPGERVAKVGAGVKWGQVQSAAGAHGLTGLAGSTPAATVVGYTLGGGVSWFSRMYGWAADSVLAFDVVDAEGRQVTVTAGSDPDLFWALRGGGGDFALVTGIEFDLYPAPAIYGGRVMWQGDRTPEVFEAFRELTANAPRELSVWINRFQFPGGPPMVALDLTYLGEASEGAALLTRLDKIDGAISDSRGVVAAADLGGIAAEPVDPSPARSSAELLTGLDDLAVEILSTERIDPLMNVQIRHLGGALAEPGPGTGAGGAAAEPYLLYMLGLGLPHLIEGVTAKQAQLVGELDAYVSGRKPYTFLAPGERAAAAFPEETLSRLRAIKQARDPRNVIRANFPVLS